MRPAREPFVVRQEPDRLHQRKLVVVTTMSIAIFAMATASAWFLLAATSTAPSAGGKPPPPAPAQIGTVETTLIDVTERGVKLRADERQALDRYGWVDRDAGLARIPIERAMDMVAEHPVPADRSLVP
jgi:hypothetical protein